MRTVLINVGLALFGLFVGVVVSEMALRAVGVLPGNPFERLINHYDGYLGYHMIPGMHESVPGVEDGYDAAIVALGFEDDVGFRDDGITPPVHSVFIGDSFVWGYGVELADSFSEQFEILTGRDSVNLGMTAFTGPTQYARVLAKYGVKLRPRYAFIGVYLGNDFGDVESFSDWEISGTSKSYPEWMTDKVKGYSPNTMAYRVRRFLYQRSAIARLLSDRVSFGFDDAPTMLNSNVTHIKTDQVDLYLDRRELDGPASQPSIRAVTLVRAAFEDIKSVARKNSIQPIVVVIPTKEMVYQEFFPGERLKKLAEGRYVTMLRLLQSTGIVYLDLLPALRAARSEQLYFARDAHWNPRGNAVAAAALRDFMAASDDSDLQK